MQVSVENSSTLGRTLTVSVPSERMEEMIEERAKRLGKTVRLPGFRPGKVPRSVIEKRFGADLLNEVAGELIQSSYQEALEKEGLIPATQPQVEPKSLERGQDLEYTASFDVYPEIAGLDVKGVRIEKPVCEVENTDVDATLDRMRKQRMDFEAGEAPAKEGDRVTIDFVGRIDGEAFEGGSAEAYPVVLGAGSIIADLDEGLTGITNGENKVIPVTFPEDYPKDDLAGKAAEFEVTVSEVAVPKMPEVDDEFATSFGIAEGGVVKLREEIQTNLERERDERVRNDVRDQVLNKLIEKSSFDVPEQMIEDEITAMGEQMKQMMGAAAESQPEPDRTLFKEEAERRVRLGLIMRSVIREREITVDAGKVRETVTRMAQGYEQPEQVIQYYYSDQQRLAQVEAQVLEQQVIDTLVDEADQVDKPVVFSTFMQPEEGAPA